MSIFQKVKLMKPRSNKFNLSHERKMSLNMGDLVPILKQDIVPGDRFRVSTESFLRFQPLLSPMMHRVNVYIHYFFVPNRLVWSEWEDFITGGPNGNLEPVFPQIEINNESKSYFNVGGLNDYLGLPSVAPADNITNPQRVSAIPHRAYQLVYNEYFRDQNLSNPVPIPLTSGLVPYADATHLMTMRKRAWEKDYFTSALPFAQRGPEVLLPIDGVAGPDDIDYYSTSRVKRSSDGSLYDAGTGLISETNGSGPGQMVDYGPKVPLRVENINSVTVSNSETTINELRTAARLQEFFEKLARGGSRYIEQIKSLFGVTSSDARLQRPEYLGGGMSPVSVSEVLSTFQSPDGEGNPQGNMAGHALSVGRSNSFSKFFEEHGTVIGIMSILPKTAYQQGIERHWQKFDRFDHYFPDFANIGEQEVIDRELYANFTGAPGVSNGTFGYQSRYAEYKYNSSTVHGDFKTNLAFWHMGRIFNSAPALNENFVMSDPTHRIFAVDDPEEQKILCQLYHRIDAIRPMPYFGTPRL